LAVSAPPRATDARSADPRSRGHPIEFAGKPPWLFGLAFLRFFFWRKFSKNHNRRRRAVEKAKSVISRLPVDDGFRDAIFFSSRDRSRDGAPD
jgi:hypothetical protein